VQLEREGYGARSEGVVAESLERSNPWSVGVQRYNHNV